ncbi:hypothetical protein MNBD_PLANCTO02-3139 [hydrothermal vent metagenome]|uniref:Uncharacterized protein n=1 Tax=hydrothermal vent metagenome TaxID=652676 RepID=A0A3B1DIT1_9ZZZZ
MTSDAFNIRTTESGTKPAPSADTNEVFFISLDNPIPPPPPNKNKTKKEPPSVAKPKQRKRRGKVVVETVEEEELNWLQKTKRAIAGMLGVGLIVSLMIHFFGGVILAFLMFFVVTDSNGVHMSGGMSDEQNKAFEMLDSSFELPGGPEEAQKIVAELQPVAISETNQLKMDNFLQPANSAKGNGQQKKNKSGFKYRIPGRAVTRGSFTIWTEPKDPIPFKDYQIIIQIKFPARKRLKWYHLKDLSGTVLGSDDYFQSIPDLGEEEIKSKQLPVINNTTQYILTVPAANELVKDVIKVQSKMLKEEQTIEIIF